MTLIAELLPVAIQQLGRQNPFHTEATQWLNICTEHIFVFSKLLLLQLNTFSHISFYILDLIIIKVIALCKKTLYINCYSDN